MYSLGLTVQIDLFLQCDSIFLQFSRYTFSFLDSCFQLSLSFCRSPLFLFQTLNIYLGISLQHTFNTILRRQAKSVNLVVVGFTRRSSIKLFQHSGHSSGNHKYNTTSYLTRLRCTYFAIEVFPSQSSLSPYHAFRCAKMWTK